MNFKTQQAALFSHGFGFPRRSLAGVLCAAAAALGSLRAAEVTLEWDAVPAAAGYRLCLGTAPGSYTRTVEAGAATSLKVTGLQPGTAYFFAAKSYSAAGLESAPSNEVTHTASLEAQQITFAPVSDRTAGDGPVVLSAAGGGSGRPVVFTVVSGPAVLLEGGALRLTGLGTVTVRASQEGSETHLPAPDAERSFTVRPLTPGVWRERNFTAAQLADPALEAVLWGPEANPDGDARSNAWEFALGSDPLAFDAEPALSLSLEPGTSEASRRAAFSFTRQNHAGAVLTAEVSGGAGEFTELQSAPEITALTETASRVALSDNTLTDAATVRRVRLKLQIDGETAPRFSEIQVTRALSVTPAAVAKGKITPKTTFAGAPLAEPLLAAGRVGAAGAFTLTPAGAAWPQTLLEAGPCYLVLTGGPNAGITADLTGITPGGALTLGDDLTGIALPGDGFAVRRHHTAGGLFGKAGAGSLQSGTAADSVDFIRPDGSAETVFPSASGSRVILPEEGFIITRRSAGALTLFQQGVPAGEGAAQPLIVPVERGTNLVCLPFTSGPVTLDQLGLYTANKATGLAGGVRHGEADNVNIPQPDGTTEIHYYSTNFHTTKNAAGAWYSSKLKASGGTVLFPGAVLTIKRQTALPAFPWRTPS